MVSCSTWQYTSNMAVSYNMHELLTFGEHLCSPPGLFVGTVLLIFLVFCVVFVFCLSSFFALRSFVASVLWKFHSWFSIRVWWSWSYGCWNYAHLDLSPLLLWVRILLSREVLATTLCDKLCQSLAAGQWFSPVSSTNKTDHHDITEILLNMALNTITLPPSPIQRL